MPSQIPLEHLVSRIQQKHAWEPPAPDTVIQLETFRAKAGFDLPEELKEFYQRCGRAKISDFATLLPLPDLRQTSVTMLGEPGWCKPTWYAFCRLRDGDWIGIDLDPTLEEPFPILDHNHEEIESAPVIARTFSEFLFQLLECEDRFWLDRSFRPSRVLK